MCQLARSNHERIGCEEVGGGGERGKGRGRGAESLCDRVLMRFGEGVN